MPLDPLDLDTFQNWLRFFALPPPLPIFSREAVQVHALWLHLHTVSCLRRGLIVSILDDSWMVEMLMQMINIL